jgi:hypothetical protein
MPALALLGVEPPVGAAHGHGHNANLLARQSNQLAVLFGHWEVLARMARRRLLAACWLPRERRRFPLDLGIAQGRTRALRTGWSTS